MSLESPLPKSVSSVGYSRQNLCTGLERANSLYLFVRTVRPCTPFLVQFVSSLRVIQLAAMLPKISIPSFASSRRLPFTCGHLIAAQTRTALPARRRYRAFHSSCALQQDIKQISDRKKFWNMFNEPEINSRSIYISNLPRFALAEDVIGLFENKNFDV